MSIRRMMKLGVIAAISAAMFGCGGGGGGTTTTTSSINSPLPSPADVAESQTVPITVSDGPINNATVSVKCNNTVFPAVFTGENGKYEAVIPKSCTNYEITSKGGTDIGNPNDPSDNADVSNLVMMAPSGATRVTPLTTLVAANPNIFNATIKNEILSNATISDPELKKLSLAVAALLKAVKASTDAEQEQAVKQIIKAVATEMSNASVEDFKTAVSKLPEAIDESEVSVNATELADNIVKVVESIESLNDTEIKNIDGIGDLEKKVGKINPITVNVKQPALYLASLMIGSKYLGPGNNWTVTLNETEVNPEKGGKPEVCVSLNGEDLDKLLGNSNSTTLSTNFYLLIKDKDSKRTARLTLTGVNLNIEKMTENNETWYEIELGKPKLNVGAKLIIEGTDKDGKLFNNIELVNENATSGIEESVESYSSKICLNLEKVKEIAKEKGKLTEDHPLYDIYYPGTYLISATADAETKDVTFYPAAGVITITPAIEQPPAVPENATENATVVTIKATDLIGKTDQDGPYYISVQKLTGDLSKLEIKIPQDIIPADAGDPTTHKPVAIYILENGTPLASITFNYQYAGKEVTIIYDSYEKTVILPSTEGETEDIELTK